MTWGAVIATAVPIAALAIVMAIGRARPSLVAASVFAGLVGAWSTSWIVGSEISWSLERGQYSLLVVGAPIMEELAKAAVVPFLAWRLRWYVDGVIVGLAAGTGFAIRENYIYLRGTPDAVSLAFARVTSTNLMHAACTALIAAAIASPVLRRRWRMFVIPPAVIVISMALHSSFNRLASRTSAAVTTTLLGVAVFVVAAGLVLLGEPLSRRWARADMEREGLALGEAEVLGRRRDVEAIFTEMRTRFGEGAADAGRRFVDVQKRIGIATQPGTTADPRALAGLRDEANVIRREVGVFAMLWLRSRLPTEPGAVGLWAATQLATSTPSEGSVERPAVGGLWNRLGETGDDPDR